MGLFQRACETYDNSTNKIGIYSQNKEPLAPIRHVVKKADLEVTIDIEGNFINVRTFDKTEGQILMPATNAALNRCSSNIAPFPLCEQLCYLAAYDEKSEQKHKAYLERLQEWGSSAYGTPEIRAVQIYVSRNQLYSHLENAGLLKFDSKGNFKSDKDMVAWKVLGGEGESATWRNLTLIQNYINYSVVREKTADQNICMISGETQPIIEHHLKGVFSLNGNAKLISSNDSANFTYRGRFNTPGEAVTVGDISSQKAHNALKWLISNQAVIIGGRAFLCWCPQGDRLPKIHLPLMNSSDFKDSLASDPSEYKELLNKAIMGYESGLSNKVTSRTVISCFDAATSGRLSVTLYSEMMTETFLSRLKLWDENCSWYFGDKIFSPSVVRIAECAFGNERDRTGNGKVELDDKVKKQQVERLIHCRLGESRFPLDIVKSIFRKASNLMNYGKYSRRELLSTACAVIKKYHYDYMKEELPMDLEKDRQDRSYQFGRLLAVYEKIERDTFGETETREPNAIRLQSVYSNQPLHYAYELDKQMERAYIPRLKPSTRAFYKNLISEIMQVIFDCPENNWNKPLKETYLMGYYLQRKSLYTKKEKNSATENGED